MTEGSIQNIEIVKQVNEVIFSYPGPKGDKGASILSDNGLPSSSIGRDGDFYLDVESSILYGPKSAGSWPNEGVLLKGSTGLKGDQGEKGFSLYVGLSVPSNSLGVDGDTYVRSENNAVYSKVNGTWQNPEILISKSNWSYTHEQQSNQYVWNINHNLGYNPSVDIIDNGGNSIEGDISYTDTNSLTITFTSLVSGFAYLT